MGERGGEGEEGEEGGKMHKRKSRGRMEGQEGRVWEVWEGGRGRRGGKGERERPCTQGARHCTFTHHPKKWAGTNTSSLSMMLTKDPLGCSGVYMRQSSAYVLSGRGRPSSESNTASICRTSSTDWTERGKEAGEAW